MKNVVYGQDHKFVYWAEDVIGLQFRPDATSIGLEDEQGNILAAVVFDGFTATDCFMHVASNGSRTWLNREYLVKCFAYPLIQLGYPRVSGLVSEHNEQALKFDLHLGFEIEGRHPKAGPNGEAMISVGMLREKCRFIPEEYRK